MRYYINSSEMNTTITAGDIKGFLKSMNMEWDMVGRYLIGYDDEYLPLYKTITLKDEDDFNDFYTNNKSLIMTMKVINNRTDRVIRVVLDPLNFTLANALYSRGIDDSEFTIPNNVSENWIQYLCDNKKGYYEELTNYYNNEIKKITDECNSRFEILLKTIKQDAEDKINGYSKIKGIIENSKRIG